MCTVLEALKSKTMLLVDLVTSESLLFTSTLLPSGCVPPRREGSHISAVVPFVRAEPMIVSPPKDPNLDALALGLGVGM